MNLAAVIDSTLLKPDCTISEIKKLCEEALQHRFHAVCIPPYYIKDAFYALQERLKIATVVGFPMGYSSIPSKVEEIKRAIDEGADEIDLVVNICAIKSGHWSYVRNEIDSVTRAVVMKGKILKTILETGLLTKEEITRVCEICAECEVHFVKTSTGIIGKGADVKTVQSLRSILPASIKIKASGGIQTRKVALELIEAGANRIGTSSGAALIGDK